MSRQTQTYSDKQGSAVVCVAVTAHQAFIQDMPGVTVSQPCTCPAEHSHMASERVAITAQEAIDEIRELCEHRAANGPDPRFQGHLWPSEVLGILALIR